MKLSRPAVLALALILGGEAAQAAARRVLYITATAGFRHAEAIDASVEVMRQVAAESGNLEIVHTEDLSLIDAATLQGFDAVYFFTSGELPLTDRQKSNLLEFVRQGKGFGGSHSATDTLYTWPEYGEMIGGYFDGHPWTQEAAVDVEDPENPLVSHMAPGFRVLEEFYQFRAFSRDRVRVLLTLDTRSVDLGAPGVNRTDGDFALAWVRNYGAGRVFYSAFGHFPESFRNPLLRTMLKQALLWLTGEIELDASPRSGTAWPVPVAGRVSILGGGGDAVAPGALVSIKGEGLTSGSSLAAADVPLPVRLAGTHVAVNGTPAPLWSVSPREVVAQLPVGLPTGPASLTVSTVNRAGEPAPLQVEDAAPGILAAVRVLRTLTVYAVGLGATQPAVSEGAPAPGTEPAATVITPVVRAGGQALLVEFSGLVPGLPGVYQVSATIPAGMAPGPGGILFIAIEAGGQVSSPFPLLR